MKTLNDDPNFSIVAPGGCNASCSFCFSQGNQKSLAPVGAYIKNLSQILQSLPSQFYQISITGAGEPLLSPYINHILTSVVAFRAKYTNILLTTNGTRLLEMFDLVSASVDHVNISRHHYDEVENQKIFGGKYNISEDYLSDCIDAYSKVGIDISVNCVINDSTTTRDFIERYILWARAMGFAAIRFRKENGTLDKTPVGEGVLEGVVEDVVEGMAKACRTDLQKIRGMSVYWKSSVVEPSDVVKEVFELVYAPDAKVYLDWAYTRPLMGTRAPLHKKPVVDTSCGKAPGSCGGPSLPTYRPKKKVSLSCGGSSSTSCGGSSASSSCGGSTRGNC